MYYLIIGGDSHSYCNNAAKQYVGFCTAKKDVCYGHTKTKIIANYTLADYVREFGNEQVNSYRRNYETGALYPVTCTVLEELQTFIPALR